jgi:hypothetical protein
MNTLFSAKMRYRKDDENGKSKKMNELFLIEAVTITDAEAILNKYATENVKGSFIVGGINKTRFAKVIEDPTQQQYYFFTGKIEFKDVTEGGKIKKSREQYVIISDSIEKAMKQMKTSFEKWVTDWEIVELKASKLVEFLNAES